MEKDEEYIPDLPPDPESSPLNPSLLRERSLTPFLRSQGRTDGRGLVFNSRISPSPVRTMRRRRKHITSPAGVSSREFTPRNLSREFLLNSSDSESEQYKHSTPIQSKSTRTESNKSTKMISKMASSRTKVIQFSDEQTSTSSSISSQKYTDGRFKTPSRNNSLINTSSLTGSPKLLFWEGDAWKFSPRTGYTYAMSLTYRETITPGRDDPMPHMARWPLHLHRGNTGVSIQTTTRREEKFVETRTKKNLLSEFSDEEGLDGTQEKKLNYRGRSWDMKESSRRNQDGKAGFSISRTLSSSWHLLLWVLQTLFSKISCSILLLLVLLYTVFSFPIIQATRLYQDRGRYLINTLFSRGSARSLISSLSTSSTAPVKHSTTSIRTSSTTFTSYPPPTSSNITATSSSTSDPPPASKNINSTSKTTATSSTTYATSNRSIINANSMLQAASISSNTPSDPPAYTSNPPTATRTRVKSYLLLSKPSDGDIQDDNNLSIWSRTCEFFFSIFSSTTVQQYFRATSATRRSGSLTAYKGVPTRRSRRLQGLPAEVIEELKKARQRRRLERQISSGSTEPVLLQAAEEPDQDDEELLEEILLQREELNDKDREKDQHYEKTNVFTTLNIFLFSLFNSLKQLFTKVGFGKKDIQKTFPLRRSRRLQGLPAEVIEELKKARQRRRLERQISSGSTEPILLQAAEEPDPDDEELLEEILLQREELPPQKEQEHHEETSIFGILSTFYFKSSNFLKQMFTKVGFEKNFNRQDLPLRRSRRLQGLPAEVIEELKKARQRRRLERQINSGSSEPILLQAPDEPDQDDEELLEEILLQREELPPQKEQEHHEETSIFAILSTFYFKFFNFLKQMFTKVGLEKKYNRQDFHMRRSRRLQGLPAEVIEELKKARQRRRLERQISSGSTSTEPVLLKAPDEPDQDDEELLEEILQREENKNQYEENISILTIVRNFCVSSLNIFTEIFTKFGFGKEHVAKRSPLRRSRRLQGLPAEVIEELKKARQRRRLERQISSGSTEPVLLQAPDEPDQDDEELLEEILQRKESNDALQENVNTPGQWNEFRAAAELKGCNHNDNEMFELSEDETDQIFPNQTSKYENSWKQFLRFLCLPVSWIHGKLSSSIPISNTVGLRKSRRLQGLPPYILEEFNRITSTGDTSRRIYGELSINQDLTPEDENILNDILLRDEFIKDPRDNSTTGENKAMRTKGAYEYNVSGVVPAVWNQASRFDFLTFLLSFLPKFLNLNSVTQDELKATTEPDLYQDVISTNICASRHPEIVINTSHQNEIIRKARLQEKHKPSKSRTFCWILIPFFLGTCFLLVNNTPDHFQLFNTSLEQVGNLTISLRENCYKYLSRSNLSIVSSLSGIQNSFSEYLSSIGEIIYDVSNSILNFFASKLEDSLSLIQSLFSWMVQLPSTGINWSWRIVSNVSSSGISFSRKIIQTVQQIIKDILSGDTINFGTWTWNLGSSIGTWTWNLGSSIGTWTWNLGSSIGTWTQNLGSYIGTSTWNLVASLGTWTQNLGSHIGTSTWNMGTYFGTWTWILGSSIGTGIQNFVCSIGICISDLASYIQNSTWNLGTSFGTLTSNLSSGIGTGIQNFAYSIRIWVQNLGSDTVTFTWNLCASFGTWTVNLVSDSGSSTWNLCASFGTWIWNLCSDLGTSAWNQGSSLGTAILTLPAHFGTGIYSSGADVSTGLFNLGSYIFNGFWNFGKNILDWILNLGLGLGTSMTSLGEGFISLTYTQGFAFGSGLVGLLIEAWTRSNKFIFSPTNNIVSTPDYETIVEHILENKRFIKSLEDLSARSNLDLETVLRESLNREISSNLDSRLDRVKEEIQGLLLDIQQKNEFNINSEKTDLSHFEAKIEEISANIENMAAKYKDVADENESKVLGLKTGIADLNTKLDEIEGGLSRLRIDLQSCCRSRVELEATISRMISEAFSSNLTPELTKNYVLKPELENIESTLMESVGSIRQEMLELIKTNIGKEKFESRLEELVRREGLNKTTGLGEREVALIVENALIQYDADKTGLFDFALETAGGSVISTRCTETYVQKSAMYSVFGIPIWYPSNNPRTIIQPGVQPGECWAFKGSSGYIVIQLSEPIHPTQFSLEHISSSMSPSGKIDSAPRDFIVYGLQGEKDENPVELGKYTYLDNSTPLQFFPVQHPSDLSFPYIELDIKTNYGNINYTCLYRFRVHGNR